MTVSSMPRSARVARRVRATLLISTALSFGVAGQAFAQNVTNTGGTGNISVTQATASGAPNAVNLQTNGGAISVNIDNVTSTTTAGQWDNAIYLMTTGNGAINGVFKNITVSGGGDVFALYANTDAGDINLDFGTIEAAGHATPGAIAQSNSGNIVLKGGTINTRGANLDPDGNSGDGLIANSATGNASATLTNGQSDSLYGSVVGALGANATTVSTYAKTTGNQGSAVFSRATTGNASTTSGTVETTGAGSGAVSAYSAGGSAIVSAGTTTVTGGRVTPTSAYSSGIDANGRTGATVTAGTTSATGLGILARSSTGDASITTTGNTTSQFGTAIAINGSTTTSGGVTTTVPGARNATINLGAGTTTSTQSTTNSTVFVNNVTNDVTINSLGTVTANNGSAVINATAANKATVNANITTNTGSGSGIYAAGANGVTINAVTTSAGGAAIIAQTTGGDVNITTTGNTHSASASAILTGSANNNQSRNATVNLGAGTTTSSAAANGATVDINVTNDVTLNSLGTVTGANNLGAISVVAGNKAVVNANVTTNTGIGTGIIVNGVNGATINAGTTSAGGISAGIYGQSMLGDVAITTTGNTSSGGSAIFAATNFSGSGQTATTGKIAITTAAGTTTSATGNAAAVSATARNDINVDLGIVTNSSGTDAVFLNTVVTGSVGKITGSIDEARNGGNGRAVFANSLTGVDLSIGTATSAGGQDIVRAMSATGNVVLDIDTVTGVGNLNAIFARATNGTASVTVDNVVNNNATNAAGVWLEARNGVTIVADNVEAAGFAVRGLAQINGVGFDGNVSITTTGAITSRSGGAISAGGLAKTFDITIGANSVVTGNGGTVVAAGTRTGSGGAGTLINNGTVIAKGNAEGAIGLTTSGDLTVVSNIVELSSTFTPGTAFVYGGIGVATTNNGNISINSNSVTVSGVSRHGIVASANGTGNVDIVSKTVSSNADNFATIRANSAAGDITIDSGTVVSGGNGAAGIYAYSSGGGDIAIKSVDVKTTGLLLPGASAAEGIYAETAGSITVDSDIVSVAGLGASGIAVVSGTGATVNSKTITVAGKDTTALYWYNSTSGDVNITSDSVTTTASNASGIAGNNLGTGATTVTSNKVSTTGGNAYGISLSGAGTQTVNSVDVTAGRYGVAATSTAGDATINLSGTTVAGSNYVPTTSVQAYGARAIGTVATINTTEGSSTTGVEYGLFSSGRDKAVVVNAGTATATGSGALGIGIRANGTNGATITSNVATATGANGYAISGYSLAGDVSITSTTATSAGVGTIFAQADAGKVTITSGTATQTSYGRTIEGIGKTGVTITAGTTTGVARGINGVSSDGDVSITTTGNTTSTEDGPGIGADGVNVAIVLGQGTVTDGFEGGIEANARGTLNIDARGTIRGHDDDAVGIKASVTGNGATTIKSNVIELTGTGEDPGTAAGFRAGQGGIEVVAEGGAVSVDSNSMTVAGDNRYGIYVLGTGAIDVKSTTLNLASKDSAGVMIVGGAGNVTVNSGAITTTGVSASGMAVRSTSGNITIVSDNVQAKATGQEGNWSAEGIYAESATGAVSITSNYASTAGDAASALVAIGGSATINSVTAATTGNNNQAMWAQGLNGDATIVAGTTTSGGTPSGGLYANATGKASITSANYTATGGSGHRAIGAAGATITTGNVTTTGYGAFASSTGGDTNVIVNGNVASSTGYGVQATGGNVTIDVAAGKTVSGKTFGVLGGARAGLTLTNAGTISGEAGVNLSAPTANTVNTVVNTGTISGTTGAAIVASGTVNLTNSGTLNKGASTDLAVLLFSGNDTVTLKTGSVVNGVIDGGAGSDTMILSGTGTTSAASQTLASSVNFENLNVASGYWTAGVGSVGFYDHATIASGATLQVNAVNGVLGFTTDLLTINGQAVVSATGTGTLSDTGFVTNGTGSLTFTGGAALKFSDATFGHTGATNVNAGTVQLASGNIAGPVTIATGATFRLGDGGTTGTLAGNLTNEGTFIYDRSDSYTIAGNFTGAGQLTKNGLGVLTFGGNYGFTGTTTINGGSVKFTGQLAPTTEINLSSGTLDLSSVEGGSQTIGELAGASAGAVALGGSDLTINQTTSTSFAGSITGTGGIEKTGTGTLNLTGVSTYSGATEVSGGTLKVNGSISNSTVVMATGGTLGGNGTVGGITGNGGIVGPGNSIGQLTVLGNIVWNPAFVYEVEVNNVGGADRIDATGTAQLGGATLRVLPEAGRYRGRTTYTILTAAGGVSGTFGTITSSFAFLTPTVTYGATTVTLALTRNNASFASFGANAGQVGVATAIQALGPNNALFEETLLLQDTAVRPAFASLTGEIYGGIASGMIENTSALRRSLMGRAAPADAGIYAWGNSLGNWGDADATSRTDHVHTSQVGLVGGVGYSSGAFDIAVGYSGTKTKFRSQGEARGTSRTVVGTAGYAGDTGAWIKVGGSYSWNDFNVARRSSLGAISQGLTSNFDGHSSQIFGEAGFMATTGQVAFGPFVGVSQISLHSDAVTEAGGSTGLVIGADNRDVTFGLFGVKVKGLPGGEVAGVSVNPNVSVAYRRAWGDTSQTLGGRFTGTVPTFGILAPLVAREAAEVGLGVEARSGRFGFSVGYTGTFAKNASNHSAQASVSVSF